MNKEKLINYIFQSKYLDAFTREKSFYFRLKDYLEAIINIQNYGKGEIYISLCLPYSYISFDDFEEVHEEYKKYFNSIYPNDAPHFIFYIIQDINKIEVNGPLVKKLVGCEFVFIKNGSYHKIYNNGRYYEYGEDE